MTDEERDALYRLRDMLERGELMPWSADQARKELADAGIVVRYRPNHLPNQCPYCGESAPSVALHMFSCSVIGNDVEDGTDGT